MDPKIFGYQKERIIVLGQNKINKVTRQLMFQTHDWRRIFWHITPCKPDSMTFLDNNAIPMIGKGVVRNINNPFLKNVYLGDGLSYNLIRISQLSDIKCNVKFEKYGCTITNFDETILSKRHQM